VKQSGQISVVAPNGGDADDDESKEEPEPEVKDEPEGEGGQEENKEE
jgi:hypothetical protein